MKTLLINDTDVYSIIKQFCPFFNHEKTEVIYSISLKTDITSIENLLEQTYDGVVIETNSNIYTHPENDTDLEEADF